MLSSQPGWPNLPGTAFSLMSQDEPGVLLARFSLHAAVACTQHVVGPTAQRQLASSAATDSSQDDNLNATASSIPLLSDKQRQQLHLLLAALRRPGDLAQRLGGLTSIAVSYRDLSITLAALQMRQHDLNPLTDDPADLAAQLRLQDTASAAAAEDAGTAGAAPPPRGTFLPLKDVTQLPEDLAVDGRSEAPSEPQYHPPYMDKISCWAAMQPTHIEQSQPLMTGIKLFPPQEAAYPTYVDFDAAQRLLMHHTSRKRLQLRRKLLRKQDKYQIKTWEHYSGEA